MHLYKRRAKESVVIDADSKRNVPTQSKHEAITTSNESVCIRDQRFMWKSSSAVSNCFSYISFLSLSPSSFFNRTTMLSIIDDLVHADLRAIERKWDQIQAAIGATGGKDSGKTHGEDLFVCHLSLQKRSSGHRELLNATLQHASHSASHSRKQTEHVARSNN